MSHLQCHLEENQDRNIRRANIFCSNSNSRLVTGGLTQLCFFICPVKDGVADSSTAARLLRLQYPAHMGTFVFDLNIDDYDIAWI